MKLYIKRKLLYWTLTDKITGEEASIKHLNELIDSGNKPFSLDTLEVIEGKFKWDISESKYMPFTGNPLFSISSNIKVDPSSELPFEVMVKIYIEDQGFQEKLIRFSFNNNIRLSQRDKSIAKLSNGQDLVYQLTEDEEKTHDIGYLEDYILNGYVYGFTEESLAEEFMECSNEILHSFLSEKEKEYKKALNSKYFDNH
jgi:hypothetical protein